MILSIEQNTVQEDTFRKLTRLSKLNLEYIWSVHFNNILTSCLISLQIKDQVILLLEFFFFFPTFLSFSSTFFPSLFI